MSHEAHEDGCWYVFVSFVAPPFANGYTRAEDPRAMGLFHVPARLTGPTGRSEDLQLLVDTGATFLVVPRDLAERLALRPTRSCPLQIAGGREETWPLAEARLALNGVEITTPCLIAPEGPPLLGAVALESLLLGVDPIAKRLVSAGEGLRRLTPS